MLRYDVSVKTPDRFHHNQTVLLNLRFESDFRDFMDIETI